MCGRRFDTSCKACCEKVMRSWWMTQFKFEAVLRTDSPNRRVGWGRQLCASAPLVNNPENNAIHCPRNPTSSAATLTPWNHGGDSSDAGRLPQGACFPAHALIWNEAHHDAAASDIPRPSGLPLEKAHSRLLGWPVSLRKLLVATAVSGFEAEKTAQDS